MILKYTYVDYYKNYIYVRCMQVFNGYVNIQFGTVIITRVNRQVFAFDSTFNIPFLLLDSKYIPYMNYHSSNIDTNVINFHFQFHL